MTFNTLAPIHLSLLSILMYTIGWYSLSVVLKRHIKDAVLRFKFITAFFYLFFPLLMGAVLICESLHICQESLAVQMMLLNVAYFNYSVTELFRHRIVKWDIVVHHVVFGGVMMGVVFVEEFETYWLWVLVVQFSTVFVALRSVLRRFPYLYQKYNARLEEADLWAFLFIRILSQTGFMAYVLADLYTQGKVYLYMWGAVILSLSLNVYWFWLILKRRRLRRMEMRKVISKL